MKERNGTPRGKEQTKKWRSLKGEDREKRMKLMGFLLRRGFQGDLVERRSNMCPRVRNRRRKGSRLTIEITES